MRLVRSPLFALALTSTACALSGCATTGAQADASADTRPLADLSVADLADLALAAPVVAEATIARITPVRDAATEPGLARGYVESALTGVIRSPGALGPEQGWLVDAPERSLRGLKGRRVLIFARTVPGRPGQLQLIAPDAQIDWTPERAAIVRRLLTAANAVGAPPAITGVGRAFHVPGPVAGEGETQLFLTTATGEPVSITVLRQPGRRPSWRLALGDVVGAAAAAPTPDSLAWVRLACGLPAALMPASLPDEPRLAEAVRADYRFVLDSLGPCGRTRGR